MAYETEAEWKAAQPDLTNVADAMERKNALESWQKSRPGYVDPMDFNTYEQYAGAANIPLGKDEGNDLTGRANFYGMTIENYQNALSGDQTRPMGGNQAVYGAQLLSPLEQRAAEAARGQGLSTMSPETLALAKANPDVFNAASQRFQNYLATTYPGTLEYESVLSGPMQFSNEGVKYPKIDDTVSMYILDPRTNQIIKNPKYRGVKKAADGGLMSLAESPRQSGMHQFAQQVASRGRGDDSLLIHMTPDEVQRLQSFAQANGRSLTINPDTGLPEAGMLSDLFKAVAPIALGAFLGPAGVALGGPGLTAGMAGLATGGITALATGSLSRGLMAGLGAYGGAGIGESLMNAGTGALSSAAGAGLVGDEAIQQAVGAKLASATPMETLTAGFNSATASPAAMGTFAKNNLTNIGMAAAPIMAGAMVPTTTKMPENPNPAYIRQKLYDPYTQTYKSLAPVKASEFGGRNFSDAYTNPQTGGIASLDQRQTTPMAAGGIVALAGGGDAALEAYQSGNFAEASRLLGEAGMSAQDVVSKYGLSQEAAAAVAKNLGYAGDMGEIQYADAAPAAPVAVSAPTAPATSYTPNRAAIEPEDTNYVNTPYTEAKMEVESSAPVTQPTAPAGIETLTAAMPPVAPVAPVTQPTAPAGIETLTAAMPPVPPVAPKVTDEQIKTWWSDPENQKLNDTQIKQVMLDNKVTPEQFANAIGANTATAADIASRYEQVGKPTGIQTLTADQTVTTADKAAADKAAADKAAADAAAKAAGVFQTVYDPATGREFSSPAQALQYGVKDYVTEMPMKLEFLNETSKKAVTDAMSRGMTFDQAINNLGSQFGMSGKDFYNYEMQGGIRSKDTALIQKAIDTESGGLTPEQLTAKLQAFKDKPPTTAKEFTEQQALYADYQRRYANSSWNYANMGGKAQDYSLKPKDYLATKFTGYADPINFALSNMKQNTTEFKEMSKIFTDNPEINDVIDQLYKINPNAMMFNSINPKYAGGTEASMMASNFNTSVKNLAGSIKQDGADTAIRQFIGNQQNLLSMLPDAQGKLGNFNQTTMSNPEYRALNAIKDSYTPIADNAAWNKQSSLGAPRGSTFSEPYRDSTTGKGLSLVYDKTGNITGVNFIDQSGMSRIVYNDPTKLIEAAYESGIPLSAFNEIAKKAGSDVLIPSQKGMRGGDYFPEGLKDGVKFSDIANGNLAKTVASPEWLNFMTKDAIDKETNLGNPEYAGGLNDKIAKLKNQNQIAKDYLADISGGSTASADTAAKTQGAPTGVAALAANQPPTQAAAKPTGIETLTAAPPSATRRVNTDTPYVYNPEWQAELEKAVREDNQPKINALLAEQDAEQRGVARPPAAQPPAAQPPAGGYTQFTNEQIGKYLRDNPTADLAKAIKDTNADPAAVNKYIASLTTPFKGSTTDERGSGTFGIYNQMKEQGIDPSEYFAAATANDPKYAGWTKDMIQEAYDLNKGMYALSEAKQGKVTDTDWAKLMVGKGTWDKPQYDPNEMAQATGLSIREVQARYDLEKLKAKAATPVKPVTPVTPAPTKVDGTKVTRVTEPTPIVTAPETALPPGVSGATGPSIVGGGTTVNPNGTITTSPRIPNIPVGGFTGMESLRDSYTKGGGSLGYTPKTPKTAADHAVAYNRMTGDSAAAYNYLMGKGAYPTQSVAASTSTGIMRPYFSEGMRYKPKFLSYDKEGNVTTSATNPNAPKAGDVTNKPSAKSINVLDNQGNTVEAVLGEDGKYHTSGGDTYDVTGKQIVAGGGMMGYAIGGGMGTLGSYSDGGRLLRGPGDGVSDSIPATIGRKQQPARLADGEFVIPARIVSELGNGSTDAGAKKLYAMMDRVQRARGKTTGKNKVAANSRADKYLPA